MRSLRLELPDRVIVLNQRHVEQLLGEFIEDYHHVAGPHQGLEGETPVRQQKPAEDSLGGRKRAGGPDANCEPPRVATVDVGVSDPSNAY